MSNAIPVGTWASDKVHSTFDFSARHLVVATYRGSLGDIDATLVGNTDGTARLTAAARVASVQTADEKPDRPPAVPRLFLTRNGTPRSPTPPRTSPAMVTTSWCAGSSPSRASPRTFTLHGEIVGPAVAFEEQQKLGLTLEGSIDRTEFGITWNANLPTGGLVLGNEVKLVANLELNQA